MQSAVSDDRVGGAHLPVSRLHSEDVQAIHVQHDVDAAGGGQLGEVVQRTGVERVCGDEVGAVDHPQQELILLYPPCVHPCRPTYP